MTEAGIFRCIHSWKIWCCADGHFGLRPPWWSYQILLGMFGSLRCFYLSLLLSLPPSLPFPCIPSSSFSFTQNQLASNNFLDSLSFLLFFHTGIVPHRLLTRLILSCLYLGRTRLIRRKTVKRQWNVYNPLPQTTGIDRDIEKREHLCNVSENAD